MGIQVAIIGLGQIGASFGLALANQKPAIQRIGHDQDFDMARLAVKKGAVDKINFNLPSTVQEADFVVLSVPLEQVRPTLQAIALDLRENCVVFDTSPIKQIVLEWAQNILPPQRYFIGLTPVINGRYLQETEAGIEAAHADLFKQGMIGIVSPPGTPERALKLATDLADLVGADHMFMDPLEVDSLMAALHLLPQLSSAALTYAIMEQPGWMDARKLTGRPFAAMAQLLSHIDDPSSLAAAAVYTKDDMLRVIDNFIAELYDLRERILMGDLPEIIRFLESAQTKRLNWLVERLEGQWMAKELAKTDLPRASDVLGRLIGIRPKENRERK